jgi:hypothetical protein
MPTAVHDSPPGAPARKRLFELTYQQARQRFRRDVPRPPQPSAAQLQSLRDRAQASLGMPGPDAVLAARLRARQGLVSRLRTALRLR